MTPASHHTHPIQMLFIFNNKSMQPLNTMQMQINHFSSRISGALQNSHHGSALNCIFCFIFPLHSTIWSALHVHIYYTFQMSKWYFTNIFQKIFSEYYTPLRTLQTKLHQSNTSSATAMVRIVCTPISTHSPPVCFSCLHPSSPPSHHQARSQAKSKNNQQKTYVAPP